MGSCHFVGSVLGCVAVGVEAQSYFTDEDRANYREMNSDNELSDDCINDILADHESLYIGDLYETAEKFVKDLNGFVFWRFFESYLDESPIIARLETGYYSGFEMTAVDACGSYKEQIKFLEAQAEDWAKYSLPNGTMCITFGRR